MDTEIDAWIRPPGVPGPTDFERVAAGGSKIRYPKSDHHLADNLIASLRRARRGLVKMRAPELVAVLGAVGERFVRSLDDHAIGEVASNCGLSRAMTEAVLDGMAESWTRDALDRLVRAEFPNPEVLDRFVAQGGREIRAGAPGVTLHLGAGSVPGVTITSMIRSLLVKSPVLAKPGAGDVALTTRLARELHRADPRLAASVAVQYWPGGAADWAAWERKVFKLADQVVVYGGNDTIESVRARTPASTRLIEHPHRLGVAIVDPRSAPGAAEHAARAVALFDQKGCVSTHLILLLGGRAAAHRWCGDLAARLAAVQTTLPAGSSPGELSALHQSRGRLAMRGAASGEIELWSADGPGWTVALATPEAFEPVGNRTAWVVPVRERGACIDVLAPMSPVLQTVGLAGLRTGSPGLAEELAALGATRIVPLDQVPFPEPEWFHDGSRPLGELVRWTERR